VLAGGSKRRQQAACGGRLIPAFQSPPRVGPAKGRTHGDHTEPSVRRDGVRRMKKSKRRKPKTKKTRKTTRVRILPATEDKVMRFLRDRYTEEQRGNRKGIVWIQEMERAQLCSLKVLFAIVDRLCKRNWLRVENPSKLRGAYQMLPGLKNYFEVTPDGPRGPNEFWHDSRCVAGFTPLEFRILKFAWKHRDNPPLVQEVLLDFWPDSMDPRKNLETHKSRINGKFRDGDLPIRLRAANNFLVFSREPATPEA
jgi:hypothetical protein